MITTNPATGVKIKSYQPMAIDEVRQIINAVGGAFQSWRQSDFAFRSQCMYRLVDLLRKEKVQYARLITQEMGKVYRESLAEIEKSIAVCVYYAEKAAELLQDEVVVADGKESFVTYQPLGVIFAVMPWNFPFWQVLRYAVPTLMAGNTCLLKHAAQVSGCALAIEKLFEAAAFPKNLFRTLLIDYEVAKEVIADPRIMGVAFTGSADAGRTVAAHAGAHLKKTVLELGGSDPYLILSDADLVQAAHICVASRMANAGQSCIAAKRFIVVKEVYDQFLSILKKEIESITYGDPMSESVDIGPLASKKLRDHLHQQVVKSIALGAKALWGGRIPEGVGAYYPPTLLVNVREGMPAYEEELFGPVAALICVKDDNEAVAVGNASAFGLGAALFTADRGKGIDLARNQLEAGSCFVNQAVHSHPALPFGGIKSSGYGRELATCGIREFVNIKSVSIK